MKVLTNWMRYVAVRLGVYFFRDVLTIENLKNDIGSFTSMSREAIYLMKYN